MSKLSAGILAYRRNGNQVEVFLVHPGGPFWARKDVGVWSIPKGEYSKREDPFKVAKREFHEETGFEASGVFIALEPCKRASGKVVMAWALESDFDPAESRSNTFEMEWPPSSGRMMEFPEVDRAEWFPIDQAREKILKGQVGLLDDLSAKLGAEADDN